MMRRVLWSLICATFMLTWGFAALAVVEYIMQFGVLGVFVGIGTALCVGLAWPR